MGGAESMGSLTGSRRLKWYFVIAGVALLGLLFGAQALARSSGPGVPLLTPTPTSTFTPTRTFTPVTGVTATPTCCNALSGTGTTTCSSEDPSYGYTYTFTNNCSVPRSGTFNV